MSKCQHCAVEELINSYGGFAEVKTLCEKLRGKYNRSGLSNTDYNELLRLEKALDQAKKFNAEGAKKWTVDGLKRNAVKWKSLFHQS
ncbi:hypothetical protein I5592_17575 [Acinetobacter baumannii]|nr:hypothetical protein I5592_17575 [Acinetobacter baumannii]